jgi:hypothetical protein
MADEDLVDLYTGTVRALQCVCEQLIDRGMLDRELLLSDLLHAQAELAPKTKGLMASVPSALSAVLGGRSPKL